MPTPCIACLLLSALFVAMMQAVVPASESNASRLFQELDADGDGLVATDELSGEHRMLFKRLVRTGDENEDGRLSAEEFAAALQPVRAEKELVEKQGSRLPGADALTVLLAKMDDNRDGRVEMEEVPIEYLRAFEQFLRPGDGDKDGALSQRELAQAAPRLSVVAQMAARRMGLDVEGELAKIPADEMNAMDRMDAYAQPLDLLTDPEQAEQLFKRLDANGDKELTADEAPAPFAGRFEEMIRRGDSDGDERLSRREFLIVTRRLAELESARPDRAAVERASRQLLRRFDADGDGELSIREAPPRIAEGFDRVDADANGRLDRSELTRVAETMARMQTFARGDFDRRPGEADERAEALGDKPPAKPKRPRRFRSN